MLQADEPERAAHPGFGDREGGGDSSCSFSPELDEDDNYLFLRDDEEYDGFVHRMEEDGIGGGEEEGDDNLSISVEQLLEFLNEPNDARMLPEEEPMDAATAQDMADAAVDDDAAPAVVASSSSPSMIEYLPSCSSSSNDINANKVFQPQKVSYYAENPVYMEASMHRQVIGLEGSLGTHETDTSLTEEHHKDLNNCDPHIPLNTSNMSNDKSLGLSSDYLKLSSPEYFMPYATGSTSIPFFSTSTNPPFTEILSDGILQLGTIDEMGSFKGHIDQNGTNMEFARMPGFDQSGHSLSFETDVDTKLSMNFSSDNIRKNGTTGHYMMPENHDSTFGIHDNFTNKGSQCSKGGKLHDVPHVTLDSTFPNILNGKLNPSTNVKLETNGSCLVERYMNGASSSVPFQDASLHSFSRENFCQGVERVGQSYGNKRFLIKDESDQSVKKESHKAHYPEVSIIDLVDSFPDPLYNQSITYVASTESSPNHILGEGYCDFENDVQCLNSRTDFLLQSNSVLPECSNKHSISGFRMNAFQKSKCVDEDAEVHILDDSAGPYNPTIVIPASSYNKSRSGFSSYDYPEEFSLGSKEKLTFQIALQEFSQPMSESSPPDGVLAVPLLRHQRIALYWMVQKETSNQNCSGGILADDQGLGKTVSTIALILSERSPSFKSCEQVAKQVEVETLSSDDEDLPPINCKNKPGNLECKKGKTSMVDDDLALPLKGRPAAGTLVVCPTSVLRQWADEIQNKVTSKGNLSFLIYHGANRTKDPSELAKYDVILTTYSIVSMEVPKQAVDDKDDDEKAKQVSCDSKGTSASRKRKHPSVKIKTSADNPQVEVFARPLAKVAWFRVILDEAQTIKNHRTLVARACCGLRAKRRWCLSGTPIQNSVDDLYSYFRFLRYDPYAVYSSFCSDIKHPINRNPTIGYRKLQVILKTILLRRTKGTFLDGEPIIKLPPKSVKLKRLDFSMKERAFYDNLEAESRAQFKAYADAGTVKENYVNILLMLLRLRQACDHPVLVQGSDSSVLPGEAVKQLSRDRCLNLLNCLEASQAICRICNDPPEDAVVSICGHVFCNQCVSEHLTGDIKQCPTAHCKVKLKATSIFTKTSLKSSIDDLPKVDISTGSCAQKETSVPKTDVFSSDSSKIKAAMDILLSLPILELSSKHVSSLGNSDFPSKRNDNADAVEVNDTCKTSPKKDEAGCSCVQECLCGKKTEKALVFSQWTRMLDLLETRLKSSCVQYRRLDGTMSIADRDKAVKEFNTVPEVTVMIMSLKAASLGLNLVSACHVILLDLWWNPTTEDQAVDRAHRIGQTRPVTVMRLTVKDTVEDRILALQEKKRVMVASAFGEDEKGSRQSRLTVEDLKYLFMM